MNPWRILVGDCIEMMRTLDAGSVRTCVTSPPYWGLRDYGVDGQIGLEETPEAFVAKMVEVFREVRRMLADDGTLWLNLGDSYATSVKGQNNNGEGASTLTSGARPHVREAYNDGRGRDARRVEHGLKTKDLVGIPWRVAFALQADGWYLRSDIVWHKPNPMPESVTDRPTKSHEYVFLLSKSPRYYYDADAVREPASESTVIRASQGSGTAMHADSSKIMSADPSIAMGGSSIRRGRDFRRDVESGRNRRTVWTIPTAPFAEAHFATYPPALVEPCILAGSARGDLVLDPFAGSGTTGMVALRHGRGFVGCELNPKYAEMAKRRIMGDSPLLNMLGAG